MSPRRARTALPHLPIAHLAAYAALRLFAAGLLFALAMACGGSDADGGGIDLGTGPGEFPKVQGYFLAKRVGRAVTCAPQNPPAGGDIAVGAYSLSEPVGFTQSGSKVSIVLMNYPNDPPDTGTVDMSGKVTLGFQLSMRENALRSGAVSSTSTSPGPSCSIARPMGTRLTGTGSYQNVLREGSATAPVLRPAAEPRRSRSSAPAGESTTACAADFGSGSGRPGFDPRRETTARQRHVRCRASSLCGTRTRSARAGARQKYVATPI